jgi:hypothetical protein
METSLDYRPLPIPLDSDFLEVLDESDQPVPFQELPTAHQSMPSLPWRKRALCRVALPPFGWRVLKMGATKTAPRRAAAPEGPLATAEGDHSIGNGILSLIAEPTSHQILIRRNGLADMPLSVAGYLDRFGSWGGMGEEEASFHQQELLEVWEISRSKVIESGPERAALFVELNGRRSSMSLILRLERGKAAFAASLRLLWGDRAMRLKLRLPDAPAVVYDVPGGEMRRIRTGQVPGVRYAKVLNGNASYGFAANGTYSYDNEDGFFTWTLARGNRFSTDIVSGADFTPEKPSERGELRADFAWSAAPEQAPELADQLEFPVQVQMTWPHDGPRPPQGSALNVQLPDGIELVDIHPGSETPEMTCQNRTDKPIPLHLYGKDIVLKPWSLTRI